MTVKVEYLHIKAYHVHVGMIPEWLSESNSASAKEQLDRGYSHGGGWSPMKGFTLHWDNSLTYPGDPPLYPLAVMYLRDEMILVYDHAWVAIVQPDRSFEVCRMD